MPGMNASLPLKWLSDGTIHGLSPLAWWLHSFGIAWSMQHESDGHIPTNALPVIEPYRTPPAARSKALRELAEVGLWQANDNGYVIERWSDSQTTHAQMEKKREKWRRDKGTEPAGFQPTEPTSTDGSTDSSVVVPPQPTKEEKSKEEKGKEGQGREAAAEVEFASEHDEAFEVDPGLRFLDSAPVAASLNDSQGERGDIPQGFEWDDAEQLWIGPGGAVFDG